VRINLDAAYSEIYPVLTPLQDGGFAAVVRGNGQFELQRYDNTGSAIGSTVVVTGAMGGYQNGTNNTPTLTQLTDGSYVLIWGGASGSTTALFA
jgi:hypothetical protein